VVKVWLHERISKNMCLKEIGVCVQNLMSFLDLIVNILWGFEGEGAGPI